MRATSDSGGQLQEPRVHTLTTAPPADGEPARRRAVRAPAGEQDRVAVAEGEDITRLRVPLGHDAIGGARVVDPVAAGVVLVERAAQVRDRGLPLRGGRSLGHDGEEGDRLGGDEYLSGAVAEAPAAVDRQHGAHGGEAGRRVEPVAQPLGGGEDDREVGLTVRHCAFPVSPFPGALSGIIAAGRVGRVAIGGQVTRPMRVTRTATLRADAGAVVGGRHSPRAPYGVPLRSCHPRAAQSADKVGR
ncbi:MAG: hypothetical protein ACK559_22900, partial [bacterium]